MRCHRNFLSGAKYRVYFKMVYNKFLELFTKGVRFFFSPHFFFYLILKKHILYSFRERVERWLLAQSTQIDVLYLLLFISDRFEKPFRSFIRQYTHVYFIFALPHIKILTRFGLQNKFINNNNFGKWLQCDLMRNLRILDLSITNLLTQDLLNTLT